MCSWHFVRPDGVYTCAYIERRCNCHLIYWTTPHPLPPTHYPLPITPHSFAPCSCALEVLGAVYESHGRMVGTLLHETVTVLIKALKTVDLRSDIFAMLRRLVIGLGPSSSSAHKDLYKALRNGLGDKNMAVRSAAAKVT